MTRRVKRTSVQAAAHFMAWLGWVLAGVNGLGCAAPKSDGIPMETKDGAASDGAGDFDGQGGREATEREGGDAIAAQPDAPNDVPFNDEPASDGCALECGPVDAGRPDGAVRGSSTLTGSIDFADASSGDAAFFVATAAGRQTLSLAVDSTEGICSNGGPFSRNSHQFAWFVLIGSRPGAEVVFAPGTYPYGAPITTPDGTRVVFDNGLVEDVGPAYGGTSSGEVTAGAITLTTNVGGVLEGHFEVQTDFFDGVSGTFTAPNCPPMPQ